MQIERQKVLLLGFHHYPVSVDLMMGLSYISFEIINLFITQVAIYIPC